MRFTCFALNCRFERAERVLIRRLLDIEWVFRSFHMRFTRVIEFLSPDCA